MILRDYQTAAVEASLVNLVESKSTLVVMATGLGKTVVLAEVARQFAQVSGKALVLAHRAELVAQNAETIDTLVGSPVDIEMAEEVAGSGFGLYATSKYISSSIQTQTSSRVCRSCGGESCHNCIDGRRYRFQKFDPSDFSLVVFDEAHHATAKTWRMVLDWYGRNDECRFLFLTATPKRSDKVGLGNVCNSVAYQMGISEAIHGGWLVPIKGKYVHVEGLDISKVKKSSTGDLADGELETAMIGDGSPLIQVASAIAKEHRPAIVFCVGKRHCELMCEALRSVGRRAESITEDTPKEHRKLFKRQLASGELDALCGVDVLTEGFDVKEVGLIACVRPTLSVSVMTQMIGRGTRPLSGVVDGPATPELRKDAIAASAKPDCLVLDFVGNTGRHKLASVFDVLGGDALPRDVAKARKAVKDDAEIDVMEVIEKARIAREKREAAALSRKATQQLAQSHKYTERDVNLFESNDVPRLRPADRAGNGATPKQIGYMRHLGFTREFAERCSKRQAGAMIDRAIRGEIKPQSIVAKPNHSKAPTLPSGTSPTVSMAEIFEALR